MCCKNVCILVGDKGWELFHKNFLQNAPTLLVIIIGELIIIVQEKAIVNVYPLLTFFSLNLKIDIYINKTINLI